MTKTEDAQVPAEPKRERRSFAVRFEGADGTRLTIRASRQRDGGARTEVKHNTRDGKRWEHQRGATEQHPTIEAARARLEPLAAGAAKLRWKLREARAGFARRPDAFDAAHLPAPGKTAKKSGAGVRVCGLEPLRQPSQKQPAEQQHQMQPEC